METDPNKEGGDVCYGDEALEKAIALLEEVGLPGGLLPMRDVIEGGHVKATGFVWIKQKQEVRHHFKKAGRLVSYGTEVKGFLTKNKMTKLHGVKAKELLIWAPIGEFAIDAKTPEKIAFKSFGGLGKSFPVVAFAKGENEVAVVA